MLDSLYIRNYAIIRELDIRFSSGLTTITGETGAGKSILLGALSLILGQRAELSVLNDKEKKCVIEGSFTPVPEKIKLLLEENDIEGSEPFIIRREISPAGKSRAFVNDSPVNLSFLKEVGEMLVDIHSQHQNLNLNDNLYQLKVLDSYSQNEKLLEDFHNQFVLYRESEIAVKKLNARENRNKKELEFLSFQFEELNKARLIPGEIQELEEELEVQKHAEEIKYALLSAAEIVNDEENGVYLKLKQIEQGLARVSGFHPLSSELLKRLTSCILELKDLAEEADHAGENIEYDNSRQNYVEERLGLLYQLMHKHQVETGEELLSIYNDLERKIEELGSFDSKKEELEKQCIQRKMKLETLGRELSLSRKSNCKELEKNIIKLLKQVGITNADFKIDIETRDEPSEEGYDKVSFLFSANKKSELQDIARIASGGELSRLMLSLKYILSGSVDLPTLIFDEIDTGVSGEIAHKVSLMMKEMAGDRQIFAITHLPQVAARGEHQFLVFKTDENNHTETRLKLLNLEERLEIIAKMLSGEQTTSAAVDNARELLGMH